MAHSYLRKLLPCVLVLCVLSVLTETLFAGNEILGEVHLEIRIQRREGLGCLD